MKFKFKVGDKVRVIKTEAGATNAQIGDVGTITYITMGAMPYAVEFDNSRSDYHSCYGKCKSDHGYWCTETMLELVENKNETIVIYRKDNTVIALDKSTGKKGIAKCDPRDTFNFMTGAELAFSRLKVNNKFGAPECRFKVGDIVTGNDNNHYNITNKDMTKGKVVEVSDDGSLIDVKIISHKWDRVTDTIFKELDAKCFDLVSDTDDQPMKNESLIEDIKTLLELLRKYIND